MLTNFNKFFLSWSLNSAKTLPCHPSFVPIQTSVEIHSPQVFKCLHCPWYSMKHPSAKCYHHKGKRKNVRNSENDILWIILIWPNGQLGLGHFRGKICIVLACAVIQSKIIFKILHPKLRYRSNSSECSVKLIQRTFNINLLIPICPTEGQTVK